MIIVEFLGPIGCESAQFEAKSLGELARVLSLDERVRPWLEKCAVAVNDKLVSDLSFALSDGDRVALLPPVCGG
ncbi:molybdenum cofactor biosynthesis protein MoaD [Campylobacterota bacterium]|nr:molybdenum cofactor biosynthesis protein MoaD [Campylobacterota bacterium]